MLSRVTYPCIAVLTCALVALPRTSGAGLDTVRIDACRGAKCAMSGANGSTAVEVAVRAPAHAGRMLDLKVYHAATYEIVYYDTAEAPPSGAFTFRIPLRSLRPGSYTFTVGPRYGEVLALGALNDAAPGLLPPVPAWPAQDSRVSE
ncbi:MAG TPA: hypothetical protein VHP37_01090 [Burkholderiales bacterium]|nr:hypothetical protein [Burkholderiales bacterium]